MKLIILTNNPLVQDVFSKDNAKTVQTIDGNAEAVLVAVRDMVYTGHPLVTHPLPASIRMIYSPYRSVVLGRDAAAVDALDAETAEESLRKYRQSTGHRSPDMVNAGSYQWIDLQLLTAALKEPLPY